MSGYSDWRYCDCGRAIDPLELCGCPGSVADYIQRRGMPDSRLVVSTLRKSAADNATLRARIAELEARQVPGWQEMTLAGQVKVGDFITFDIGDTRYLERVKVVINEGTAEEELIYNKKKNYYVIVHNVLTGFGNVKNFRYLAAPSADSGEVKP